MEPRRIVTCTDFSDAAAPGLEAAFALAKRLSLPVKVLHVFVHPLHVDPEIAPTTLAGAEEFLREARQHSEEHLQKRMAELAGTDVEATGEVLEGAPDAAIREHCTADDLLVLSTHGRTGARRLLLGSVAERLVRTAPCPVLTVPSAPE